MSDKYRVVLERYPCVKLVLVEGLELDKAADIVRDLPMPEITSYCEMRPEYKIEKES